MSKILVVDDFALARESVAKLLEYEGFTALRAKDGREGLAMVNNAAPDLVLLDLVMPGMDGVGLGAGEILNGGQPFGHPGAGIKQWGGIPERREIPQPGIGSRSSRRISRAPCPTSAPRPGPRGSPSSH